MQGIDCSMLWWDKPDGMDDDEQSEQRKRMIRKPGAGNLSEISARYEERGIMRMDEGESELLDDSDDVCDMIIHLAQKVKKESLERKRLARKADRALVETQQNKSDIARIENKVDEGFERIDNGYIYPEERESLESIRYARALKLLGLDVMNPESDEYETIKTRYVGRFVGRMTRELKKRFGVTGNWYYLRHSDYLAACDFFQNWRPAEGVETYKRQIDRRAKANARARDEGYSKRK